MADFLKNFFNCRFCKRKYRNQNQTNLDHNSRSKKKFDIAEAIVGLKINGYVYNRESKKLEKQKLNLLAKAKKLLS